MIAFRRRVNRLRAGSKVIQAAEVSADAAAYLARRHSAASSSSTPCLADSTSNEVGHVLTLRNLSRLSPQLTATQSNTILCGFINYLQQPEMPLN